MAYEKFGLRKSLFMSLPASPEEKQKNMDGDARRPPISDNGRGVAVFFEALETLAYQACAEFSLWLPEVNIQP